MKTNILIFRTDRIGDLLVTCPAIIAIKKHFEESNITLIASEKNIDYAKSLNIFNQIYLFPNSNIFKKIIFLYNLRKNIYDYIFVFDGKERSIISTAFCTSKNKFAVTKEIKNIYKLFKINFFIDNENTNLNTIFQNILSKFNVQINEANYNFLNNKKNNSFSENISSKSFIHLHIDEKWFTNLYINSYTNINPTYDEIIDFVITMSEASDVVITTGVIDINLVNQLKDKFFEKVTDKIFVNKKHKNLIYLIFKPTYDDIESLLRKTRILIACHGAITHASNSFNVIKIDILEKSKIGFYKRFSSYLNNYFPIFRANFDILKKEIYQKVLKP